MNIKEFWLKLPRDLRDLLFATSIVTGAIVIIAALVAITFLSVANSIWALAIPLGIIDLFLIVAILIWVNS